VPCRRGIFPGAGRVKHQWRAGYPDARLRIGAEKSFRTRPAELATGPLPDNNLIKNSARPAGRAGQAAYLRPRAPT